MQRFIFPYVDAGCHHVFVTNKIVLYAALSKIYITYNKNKEQILQFQ